MNQRERHLAELKSMGYQVPPTADPFYPLIRLEAYAHTAAEQYCNGDITEEESDERDNLVTRQIKSLFNGTLPPGFFINGDPRGYALKIEQPNDKRLISFIDLGGYGILAPEFEDR